MWAFTELQQNGRITRMAKVSLEDLKNLEVICFSSQIFENPTLIRPNHAADPKQIWLDSVAGTAYFHPKTLNRTVPHTSAQFRALRALPRASAHTPRTSARFRAHPAHFRALPRNPAHTRTHPHTGAARFRTLPRTSAHFPAHTCTRPHTSAHFRPLFGDHLGH